MLGEALSLASAVSWGAAVVLYKKSDEVHPETMNLFWIGGFKYTTVSVAAILGQMATIFTLVFARIFLGELLTPQRIAGAAAAAAGAVLLVR